MGSNSSSGGGGGGSNRYEPPKKKNPVVEFVKGGGITGAVVRGVSGAFKNEKNLKEAKKEDALGGEMLTRERRTVSIAGGSQRGNDNSNVGAATSSGMVVQSPTVTSPTTAEVSQVTSEEARASANELILKKRKGRGRSSTILTSAQGVQDNKGLTLGKPSLLG
jgi:hypothetical protein